MSSQGRVVERRDFKRDAFGPWLRRLPMGCIVGIEPLWCFSSLAREMSALGFQGHGGRVCRVTSQESRDEE